MLEFLSDWLWVVVLVPLAGMAGWVIGRRGGSRLHDTQVSRLSTTYFRGLNYLLTEQPDKAIELFLHVAELDRDTFETQVAIGHLFRRRGEVDRAIRMHQGLVERTDINDTQRIQAMLALGEDYMRSGLLDRAETVFTDLARLDARAPLALKHLIGIYESERDWGKAIENARRYQDVTGEAMGREIAQFECELAERHRLSGEVDAARESIKRAYAADPTCCRAGMIEGRIAIDAGQDRDAIRAWERAARHDPDYLPEILPGLLEACERVKDLAGARRFLTEMTEHYRGVAPVLALTRLVEREDGPLAAREYLSRQLLERPSVRGESALIDLALADAVSDARATLAELHQITEQLLVSHPAFRCNKCGFGARALHWQCPSCRSWATVKPLPNHAIA